MKIFTCTGSIYEIDFKSKTWIRLKGVSPNLRTESGKFISCNNPVINGRLNMICPALNPDILDTPRFISTSIIIRIE